jgi:23S rRNA (cytidine1920-2'-O)/16S rRNA (cytidine1409-2'-O)-methyltransferase
MTVKLIKKERLDKLLLAQNLAESREQAQRLIMAGEVLVNGQRVDRPSTAIDITAVLTLLAKPPFVSRGGIKLQAAFESWQLDVTGQVCVDVGASTGGFTDCLLQHGAAKVYAVDVGKGILHHKLRSDSRVVVLEETNARYLTVLPEPVTWVTVDAAFISLQVLLPVIKNWLAPGGQLVVLIKPQFEVGPQAVGKGGVCARYQGARTGGRAGVGIRNRFGTDCSGQPRIAFAWTGW